MNTENNPLVSVIVRTKDRPALLKRAVQSIASQTYRPLDVVLVNDGGSDPDIQELRNILGDVDLQYKKIEKSMGRANAINEAAQMVKGEFISFLDDDDLYFPSGIESVAREAQEHSGMIVYGKVMARKYSADGTFSVLEEKLIGEPFDPGRLILENFIPINSICIPRLLFAAIGPLDDELVIYEDWDMMIRLSEKGSFHFIDSVIAEYSIIGSATLTGKGGAEVQNTFREKVLSKHIHKVDARSFLLYLQSVIDRIVIEKDGKVLELAWSLNDKSTHLKNSEERIRTLEDEGRNLRNSTEELRQKEEDLEKAIEIQNKTIRETEEALRVKDEKIREMEGHLRILESSLADKDRELGMAGARENELRLALESFLASHSWKLTAPLRKAGETARKLLSKINA